MAKLKVKFSRVLSLTLAAVFLCSVLVTAPIPSASAAMNPAGQLFGIIVKATGKAMDVDNASKQNGAKILQWSYDGGFAINQQWYLTPVGGGYFGIINNNSGCAMDVDGISKLAGANVNQWDHNQGIGVNQQWKFIDVGDGWYEIVNKNSGLCMSIEPDDSSNIQDRGRLKQNLYSGSDWQKFRVEPFGQVKIVNRNSSKVVQVAGASKEDGATINQWDYTGVDEQLWNFTSVWEGYYGIVNKNSGKAIDVDNFSTVDGAKIDQWSHDGGFGTNQQWRLAINDEGYFSILNRNSGKALDVDLGSMDNDAAVLQWNWTSPGGANQQWTIEGARSVIGWPTFTGTGAAAEPVGFTTDNMMQEIYDKDLLTGDGTSFWMDRMLVRYGNDPSTSDSTGNMLSKGRSIWMGWHDPSKLGFAGEVAYIDESDQDNGSGKNDGVSGYTIDLTSSGLTEDVSKRVSYPSYWTSEYNDSDGLNVNIKKFFTENNVAVSVLNIKNNSSAAKDVTMTVKSPRATIANGSELTGQYKAPMGLTTVYPRISGDDLTASSSSSLIGTFSVAAGETVSKKVVMGFITNEIPASTTDYNRFKEYDPAAAFAAQVREYNLWWVNNIPYIDVQDNNIKKMIYYRWWITRFNVQDDELPISKGYAFPTSVEGVTGYNNAISLSIPWQLEESRYLRNPDLNYGTWLSMGATSGGGAFKDNLGSPYWPNEYNRSEMKPFSQYISKAGWESYKVFGGQNAIVSKFADYGYGDSIDFMARYDADNDYIVTLPDGSWTGFDSDSPVTKYFNSSSWTGGPVASLCTAYNFANAQATSEMYNLIGNTTKANEMNTLGENIKNAVLTKMWDSNKKQFLHKDVDSADLNPWKDITNFYPYTMGLVPTDNTDYREMFKLWNNPDDFVVWPAFMGDIQDSQSATVAGKAMSFNSAPSAAGVNLSFLAKAVKDYPSSYITPELYKKQLYWGTWGYYVNGNTEYPDTNEFWASANESSIGYRSWIHHNQHSKYNVSIIEDIAGLTPRLDNSIELNPIDIGWNHFTVNNLKYHGSDLTIIWNGDEFYTGAPKGYSVYIDGTQMFTVDSLKHLIWDASTGSISFPDGDANISYNVKNDGFKTADEVSYTNGRVADMFKKVGVNLAGSEAVTGVSIDQSEMSIFMGETKQMIATVQPDNAINQLVSWESSDSNIASVDQDGNVTGVSGGEATITAVTDEGGYSAFCNVTVSQASVQDLSEVILDKNELSLVLNESGTITAIVQSTFNNLTDITLNKKGTGFPEPSASYICGSDNVWNAINGDDDSSKRWTSWNSHNASDWFQIDFGTNKQINRLELDFFDDKGGVQPPVSYKVMYWDGTQWVNVENINKSPVNPTSGIKNIVLFDEVNSQKIRIEMTNISGTEHGTYVGLTEIRAYYDPYYLKDLNWSSGETSIATVDQNGNVLGIGPGTTTIAAITADGLHQNQCVVTVMPLVDKTDLAAAIEIAQGKVESNYTTSSAITLNTALNVALDVKENAAATQSEVDIALANLNTAISGLVAITPETPVVDKTDLTVTIETTQGKVEGNYTTASWTTLQIALTAALNVKNNAIATQSDVDIALANLNTAIAGLVIKSTDNSSGNGNEGKTSPTPLVVVPQDRIEAPKPVINSNGIAVTTIDAAKINTALQAFDTIVITVPRAEGAREYELILPVTALASGDHSKKIGIEADMGKVSVPGNMLTALEVAGAKSVSITISKADTSELDAVLQTQIGLRPVVELSVRVDGKSISWSNPEAPVTVEILYTPTTEELANPEHIVVLYIDGAGKVVSVPTGKYDPTTGKVTFTTTHFSNYAIAYVNKSFGDISGYPWAIKAIEVMASKGVINGTSAKSFTPSAAIKRGDFILMLVKALGLNAKCDENFSDISAGAYYAEAISIAKKLGIIAGVGDNKFKPDEQISRQDMMTMMDKAMKVAKKSLTLGSTSDLDKFKDKARVASYAVQSVSTLVKNGIVSGSGANLNPLDKATRAETAVLIYKLYQK